MDYKYLRISIGLLVIALGSCHHLALESESGLIQGNREGETVLVVKEGGFDLRVSLSERELTEELRFEFNRDLGHVEFVISENFNFTIVQEDAELSEIKKDLEENAVFSYKFYNRTDNELFYQNVLPDGTELGYHLIRKTRIKNKNYIIKSNTQFEFSKDDIESAQLILNKVS